MYWMCEVYMCKVMCEVYRCKVMCEGCMQVKYYTVY